MQLFYNPNIAANTSTFSFDKEESKHIVKVLRKSVDDSLNITNGKGWLFEAKITAASIKNCQVEIIKATQSQKKNYSLHLAVAPTKMNDRFEWFLEKATEIGVDTITPILCDHSERKIIKQDRFNKIIQSAMKQSLQNYLPQLKELTSLEEFLKLDHSGQRFIAHCEDSKKQSLKELIEPNKEITILIGPEGDFSSTEIANALQSQFVPVSLGNTRLRTETAAITACHSVAFVNEE